MASWLSPVWLIVLVFPAAIVNPEKARITAIMNKTFLLIIKISFVSFLFSRCGTPRSTSSHFICSYQPSSAAYACYELLCVQNRHLYLRHPQMQTRASSAQLIRCVQKLTNLTLGKRLVRGNCCFHLLSSFQQKTPEENLILLVFRLLFSNTVGSVLRHTPSI